MVDPQWIIEQHKTSDILLRSQRDEFKKYIDDVKRTSKFYGRNLNNEDAMKSHDIPVHQLECIHVVQLSEDSTSLHNIV